MPRYHVATLTSYHVNELPYYLRLQFEVLQFEVLKTCHVICALCVVLSYFAVEDFAVVGVLIPHPPATPAADR